MAKLTQEEILSYLEEATILELNDLVSAIEEKIWCSSRRRFCSLLHCASLKKPQDLAK